MSRRDNGTAGLRRLANVAAMAAGLAAALCTGQAQASRTIPPFTLDTLGGKHYTANELTGHPTLLVFWAPWCPVCRVELPEVNDLYRRWKSRGLRIIGIAFADSKDDIRDYVNAHRQTFTFPTLYDPGDRTATRFGVIGTPTVYLFDASGRQVLQTWLIEDPRLNKALKRLMVPETR